MNKKLILMMALLSIFGPLSGMSAQKLSQMGRFSWTGLKASMPSWRKTYNEGYKQAAQSHYRSNAVKFNSSGMLYSGAAILSLASLKKMSLEQNVIEFTIENIDVYPEKKADFAAFVAKELHVVKEPQTINHELVKSIVHFINTYPDQVAYLSTIAQNYCPLVHPDIQYALAAHNKTFRVNIKPHYTSSRFLLASAVNATARSTLIQVPLAAIKIPAIDNKIIESGCIEFSPEYWAAWNREGKDIRNQLGKNIAHGVAVHMCQSIAIDMINEKINDKKVSQLLVKVGTPLLANAYNKKFTLRDNAQDVLAVAIDETINAIGEKASEYLLPEPRYNKDGYNPFYYSVNGVYWLGNTFAAQLIKKIAVSTISSTLAEIVTNKTLGPKSSYVSNINVKA